MTISLVIVLVVVVLSGIIMLAYALNKQQDNDARNSMKRRKNITPEDGKI